MTEKRFRLTDTAKITKDNFLTGIKDVNKSLTPGEVVEYLNNLHEENEQLKQQLTSILKLIQKIEDYTHDMKLISDFE